jgi:hypothetical protein
MKGTKDETMNLILEVKNEIQISKKNEMESVKFLLVSSANISRAFALSLMTIH